MQVVRSELARQSLLRVLPYSRTELKRTPRVNAPETPCTTAEAIESWNPKRSVIQPPALQPQAASRIQTTEPRIAARTR